MTDVEIILNYVNVLWNKRAPVDIISGLNNGLQCIKFQCPGGKQILRARTVLVRSDTIIIPRVLFFSFH